jgi:AGCS family alanine or glycine:cation symporter
MFVIYLLGGLIILGKHVADLPEAFALIFREAFTPSAGVGGTAAGIFATTMIWGVKRGLFSNEAGQGSAPIAHAAAKTDKPVREGIVAMLGPFIDTIVICSFTGLVIVLTGVWSEHKQSSAYLNQVTVHETAAAPERGQAVAHADRFDGTLSISDGRPVGGAFALNDGFVLDARIETPEGAGYSGPIEVTAGVVVDAPPGLVVQGNALQNSSALTTWAFERELGLLGVWIVTLSVFLFAISTTISWSYYGDRCTEYLFGAGAVPVYRWFYTGFIFLGATLALEAVWAFGDLALGLMSAPNLIAIFLLTGRVKKMTDQYQSEKQVPLR